MIEAAAALSEIPVAISITVLSQKILQDFATKRRISSRDIKTEGTRPEIAEVLKGLGEQASSGDANIIASMAFKLSLLPEDRRAAAIEKINEDPREYPNVLKKAFSAAFVDDPDLLKDKLQEAFDRREFLDLILVAEKKIPQRFFKDAPSKQETAAEMLTHIAMARGEQEIKKSDGTYEDSVRQINEKSHTEDWKQILFALPKDVKKNVFTKLDMYKDTAERCDKREFLAPFVAQEWAKVGLTAENAREFKGLTFPQKGKSMSEELSKRIKDSSSNTANLMHKEKEI